MLLEVSLESQGLGKGWTTSQNTDALVLVKIIKHPYQKRKMLFKGPTKVPECFKCLPTELDHHDFIGQSIIFLSRLFPSLPPIQLWTKVSHLGESMTPPPPAGFLPPTGRSRDVAEVKSKILISKIDWTF